MPALGGAAAEPLRFLDFLIYQPVRAVVLHGAGVPVLVPSPERFAIHKLIVGSRRRLDDDGTVKSRKDRRQAETLMTTMIEIRKSDALADAYMEAWDRGPAWREAIRESQRSFDGDTLQRLRDGLVKGVASVGGDPAAYGLDEVQPTPASASGRRARPSRRRPG
jgi:hypothetical protein